VAATCFDAVRQCIAQLGVVRTIRELRLAAGLELNLNSELYRPLYAVENEYGQNIQACTYDEFVRKTRDEKEWATQMTVAALAKALDVVIRVISTDTDRSGCNTAFSQDYCDGVNCIDKSVIVGFNKESSHYIGFLNRSTAVTPVVLHMTAIHVNLSPDTIPVWLSTAAIPVCLPKAVTCVTLPIVQLQGTIRNRSESEFLESGYANRTIQVNTVETWQYNRSHESMEVDVSVSDIDTDFKATKENLCNVDDGFSGCMKCQRFDAISVLRSGCFVW